MRIQPTAKQKNNNYQIEYEQKPISYTLCLERNPIKFFSFSAYCVLLINNNYCETQLEVSLRSKTKKQVRNLIERVQSFCAFLNRVRQRSSTNYEFTIKNSLPRQQLFALARLLILIIF